jgi:hypothetical protein
VELEGLAVADDRVTGVVPTLEADDEIGVLGQEVDDLSLALVAPLGTDNDETWHGVPSVGRVPVPAPTAYAAGAAMRTAGLAITTPPAPPCARRDLRSRRPLRRHAQVGTHDRDRVVADLDQP